LQPSALPLHVTKKWRNAVPPFKKVGNGVLPQILNLSTGDDAERVSSALPIKNFHFKNPIWRTVDTLEKPVRHHHEILQFVDFKMAAVRHLGILKLKFLTANISKTCCSLSR